MRWERIPEGLRVRTPAKLNLYLEVGPRRADGYHDIDSIFQTVTLFDELEFHRAPDGAITLEEKGIAEQENNLVLKAARLLGSSGLLASGPSPGARIRLAKGIPEGAGMGGGSSDAAATLLGLCDLWGIKAGFPELLPLASQLGSDVPFFLVGGTARCRGRGEKVESWAVDFDREPLHFVLACPPVKVSTKLAYEALDRARGPDFALTAPSPLDSIPAVSARAQLRCGNLFYNRFESVVYEISPDLRRLHETLSRHSFLKVLLTGSGSTIYGVCRDGEEAGEIVERLRGRVAADMVAVSSEPSHGLASVRHDTVRGT